MGKSIDLVRQRELDQAIAQARGLRDAAKVSEAAQLVASVVQSDPDHVGALRLMGSLAMRTGTADIAIGSLSRASTLSPRSVELFVELGEAFLFGGKPAEAETAFRKAIAIRPRDGAAFRGLGKAQLDAGNQADAVKSFRKAHEILPYDLYSGHMAAALSGQTNPSLAAYVGDLFDNYAGFFDEHLTDTLQYRIPEIMAALVARHTSGPPSARLLDLGCGTGLVGVQMHGVCSVMDGIDISRQMIAKAAERNLYRTLSTGDIVEVLSRNPDLAGPYDLVTAADVFIYLSDLEAVFSAVRSRLNTGGLFCFSVESREDSLTQISSSGRFGHSPSYIADLTIRHDFVRVESEPVSIRHERHEPVAGILYLLTAK